MATLRNRGPGTRPAVLASPGVGGAPALLELGGIVKAWPRQPFPVLDGLELTLRRGEALWIGGRNGVGKTTMLRLAAGMILADRGSVTVAGIDPRDRRAFQLRVGFVSAGNSGLHARLSTRRHLDLWARLAFIARADRPDAIDRALATFQLDELADRRVDRMSMGQRQRLRLAGAFLHSPELVLLDEPLNSLDEDGAAILSAAVRGLIRRGGATVWCEPAGGQGAAYADRRCLLDRGRLIEA